jgi:hypothetical protein
VLACEVLEEIGRQSSSDRDTTALPEAVEALLKAVSDEHAVDHALAIKDSRTRALVLSSMADKLGGYEWNERTAPATRAASEAMQAALSLNDPEIRDAVVAAVLEPAARADLIPLALAGARSVSPSRTADRSQTFCTIATTVAERGRFDEAWQIAQECSANEKLLAYAAILRVAGTDPAMRRFAPRHGTGK